MSNGLLHGTAINFSSGKAALRSLSNFWECLVVIDGRDYESGEHAFHGEKYMRLGELAEDPTTASLARARSYFSTTVATHDRGRREAYEWVSFSLL